MTESQRHGWRILFMTIIAGVTIVGIGIDRIRGLNRDERFRKEIAGNWQSRPVGDSCVGLTLILHADGTTVGSSQDGCRWDVRNGVVHMDLPSHSIAKGEIEWVDNELLILRSAPMTMFDWVRLALDHGPAAALRRFQGTGQGRSSIRYSRMPDNWPTER